MAYPTIDAPYGLVPVGLIGGRSYSGATRQMRIASNYGTAIGKGDLVKRKYNSFPSYWYIRYFYGMSVY